MAGPAAAVMNRSPLPRPSPLSWNARLSRCCVCARSNAPAISATCSASTRYRRRILVQLNRGEGRHQLARVVFHGKRGELRQRYREGQEDQLGALGLVVNVIVLWNSLYMDAALNQLRAEGYDVRDEDVTRLSPLGFEHINMLGRYAFTLPETVARGEMRPLRNPASVGNEADEPVLT
jgi:hypothetical protein